MNSITNIDQIIAVRDFCKGVLSDHGLDLDVFDAVYPNKNLPKEFLLARSIVQTDDGRPVSDGTVEICIYVANQARDGDQSQPDLNRLGYLTGIFVPAIRNASKNKIAFNDFRVTLVKDDSIRYFYQSIVMDTVSINV